MRRKLITMAVVLLLLGALCTIEQIAVRRITDAALEQTRAIMEDIRTDALEEAIKKAHTLDKAWDGQAKLLEMMVDHSSTDDVRYALSKLIAALESDDTAAAMIYAGELDGSIEHVYERQELTPENLL